MAEKKAKLNDMQYYVTQECGTEPAFDNEYWDKKEPGIYVDIISVSYTHLTLPTIYSV